MASAYDLHFQLAPVEDQNGTTLFTFGYASARAVRGFQKTINQWVKCLLTARGSDLVNRSYGTEFTQLLQSNITNEAAVEELIAIAVNDATSQMLAMQRAQPNLPNDERLASASLARVQQTSPTGFVAYVVLKNVLNQGVKYALPAL